MDTNKGESPGHQSQSQQLGNSPSEEEMSHWTPTGIEPMDYDDDDDNYPIILANVQASYWPLNMQIAILININF